MSRTPGQWLPVVLALALACNRSENNPVPARSAVPAVPADAGAASGKVRVVERTTTAMRTLFTVGVTSATDNQAAYRAVKAAFDEIHRVENLMTVWKPDSYLSRVNRAAGIEPVAVPAELVALVAEAERISALTGGKFNIAAETLRDLWQFKARPPQLPAPSALAARLPLLDYRNIVPDSERNTVFLRKAGMRIGLGAIAKGYAADRAGEILRAHGIGDFFVNCGGDVLFSGRKGDSPWDVGIRDPRRPDRTLARFDVDRDSSVSTSGDYESFFVVDGKRYHHIIDPTTGYPARGTVSATVIASTATLSDALATAVFVLGPDRGMRLVESDPYLEAIVVDDRLQVHVSAGMKDRLRTGRSGTFGIDRALLKEPRDLGR